VSTEDLLAERYGRPAPWRRPVLLGAAGVVVTALVAMLAWVVVYQANPSVASGELTFDIVDDRSAVAQFTVDLSDPDVEATCTLRAYAEDKVLVGNVAFAPEPDARGRVEQTIATDRRATSVELVGCTAPGQARPR
jgi:hypothetical protein